MILFSLGGSTDAHDDVEVWFAHEFRLELARLELDNDLPELMAECKPIKWHSGGLEFGSVAVAN